MIVVVAVAAGVAAAPLAAVARGRVASVVRADAPSVQAAGDFRLRVADMDAQLADILLVHDDTSLSIRRADGMRLYEADRAAADADLTAATAVLAGNDAAQRTLRNVSDLFGTYQEKAVRTMELDELAHLTTAGNAPANVLGAYRNALAVLEGANGTGATPQPVPSDQGSLLAQAGLLQRQSSEAIQRSTASAQRILGIAHLVTGLTGTALIVLLAVFQIGLYRKFHRILNPFILAASIAAVLLLAGGSAAFTGTSSDLRGATSDAFGSIQALTDAKALAYDANADESRWLLDPTDGEHYEADFLAKSQDIAGVDGPDVPDDVATMLNGYEPALRADLESGGGDAGNQLHPGSAFGTEFRNITYPGEKDAALEAMAAYDAYQRGDSQLRSGYDLHSPARLRQAIDFDTDVRTPASSDAMFGAFSDRLDQVIAINQQAFDASSARALAGLAPMAWEPYAEAGAILVFVGLGLRRRVAEYR